MTQTNKLQDSQTQSNKAEWLTMAFFKRAGLQYSKATFLKRKLYLHSLYFSQKLQYAWGTFEKLYRGVFKTFGKTLKLKNYPKTTMVVVVGKTQIFGIAIRESTKLSLLQTKDNSG